jgi:HEAT repeat protein
MNKKNWGCKLFLGFFGVLLAITVLILPQTRIGAHKINLLMGPKSLRLWSIKKLKYEQYQSLRVDALCVGLGDPEKDIRKLALEALKSQTHELYLTTVSPYVLPLINDPDPEIRSLATALLSEISRCDSLSIPALKQLIQHKNPQVRFHTLRCLEKISPGEELALPIVKQAFSDKKSTIRIQALECYASLAQEFPDKWDPVSNALKTRKNVEFKLTAIMLLDSYKMSSPKAIVSLKKALKDPRLSIRAFAARALISLGHRDARHYQVIKEAISQPGFYKSKHFAMFFKNLDSDSVKKFAPELIALANKEGLTNVDGLLAILPKLGPRAAPLLANITKQFKNSKEDISLNLIRTAAAIGPRAAPLVPKLRALMGPGKNRYHKEYLCAAAILKISKDDPQARSYFLNNQLAKELPTAKEALLFLQADGAFLLPALIEIIKADGLYKADAVELLGAMGPSASSAVPTLLELCKQEENSLFHFMAGQTETLMKSLGQIGPEANPCAPYLIAKLNSPYESWTIKLAAAKSLGTIKYASSDAIKALKYTGKHHSHRAVRVAAKRALAKLQSKNPTTDQ